MKKKILISLIALMMLSFVAVAASDAVKVYVNGERVDGDAFIVDGRTYIPLRAVSEAMGAEVGWNDSTKTATVDFTEDNAVSQLVENVSPSVVAVVGNYSGSSYNTTAHGTGVVLRSNGIILTNAHVVDDITNVTVILYDGSSYPAQVLFSDETADLAILKIDKIGLKPIKLADSADISAGKTVIAIGTPISLSMRNSVTKGIISIPAVSITGSYYKLIQTDAAINPGNSGGPLLNMKGEMVGINSSGYVSVAIQNVSFAIPVDTVNYIVDCYEKKGYAVRANIGLELEQSKEASIGLPTPKGLTVKTSKHASIQAGDVVTAVNGVEVHSTTDLNEALKRTYNGSAVDITLTRGGVQSTVSVPATDK